jgi:hypothetical protein
VEEVNECHLKAKAHMVIHSEKTEEEDKEKEKEKNKTSKIEK